VIATPSNPWKLGVFVVLAIGLAILALVWFGAARFDRRSFFAMTLLDESVQGLDVGSPVNMRGVNIGRVRSIQFAPDRRLVEIVMEIYLDVVETVGLVDRDRDGPLAFVEEGVRVQLSRSGITGITFLQVDFFPPEQRTPPPELSFLPSMPLIPSVPSRLKSLEDSLVETLNTLPTLLSSANTFVQRLDRDLRESDVPGLAARAHDVVELLDARLRALPPDAIAEIATDVAGTARAARELTEALGLPSQSLLGAVITAENAFAVIAEAVQQIDAAGTGESVRRASDQFGQLASTGVLTLESLAEELAAIRRAFESIRLLAELLERDPGILLRGRGER
jgi:phospholipid/cholesterol/gamma-HCH transport system substrate-binding protein